MRWETPLWSNILQNKYLLVVLVKQKSIDASLLFATDVT